ncbi:MAG: helicase [Verrucomicrobiota bacterium]
MNLRHSFNSSLAGLEPSIVRRGVNVGGIGKSQLLSHLAEAGVELNEYARVLFASDLFTTSPTEQHWMTVEVSVRDLGFTQGASIKELHSRASVLGLLPPPLELAPHLRLQYLDQPEGSWGHPVTQHRAPSGSITIASVPLSEDDEFPKGFYLRRIEGTLWLRGYQCSTDNHWNPDDHLLFCQA